MPSNRELTGVKAKILSRLKNVDPALAAQFANTKLPWFTVMNAASEEGSDDAGATDIFVYDEIGGSFGVDATELVMAINETTSEQINVRINSPGGSVFDAIAIYNALRRHPANVTTYVDALAASAASIIAMGGDECVMMVGSQMMIHDALGAIMGNAADFTDMADFLGKQSDNIASIYADKAGGDITDWRTRMLAETWMFAAEAVEMGLADRVYTTPSDMPEQVEPEAEVDQPEEAAPEAVDNKLADIEVLMHARHVLTNRGFKHAGRKRAPEPPLHNSTMSDDDIDRFKNSFAQLLGR